MVLAAARRRRATVVQLGVRDRRARRLRGAARRLVVRDLPETVGVQPLDATDPGAGLPSAGMLGLEGALRSPSMRPAPWPDPPRQSFQLALRGLLAKPPGQVETLVTPPVYGAQEAGFDGLPPAGSGPLWLQELNLDPRHRAAAGLGARVVERDQAALAAAAWQQSRRARAREPTAAPGPARARAGGLGPRAAAAAARAGDAAAGHRARSLAGAGRAGRRRSDGPRTGRGEQVPRGGDLAAVPARAAAARADRPAAARPGRQRPRSDRRAREGGDPGPDRRSRRRGQATARGRRRARRARPREGRRMALDKRVPWREDHRWAGRRRGRGRDGAADRQRPRAGTARRCREVDEQARARLGYITSTTSARRLSRTRTTWRRSRPRPSACSSPPRRDRTCPSRTCATRLAEPGGRRPRTNHRARGGRPRRATARDRPSGG